MPTKVTTAEMTKDELSNIIILSTVLNNCLSKNEKFKPVIEALRSIQKEALLELPELSKTWVLNTLTAPKFETFSTLLQEYARIRSGAQETLYIQLHDLFGYINSNRSAVNKLNMDKYLALIKFIKQELQAEIFNGTTALELSEGSLVFKLVQPSKLPPND